VETDDFKKIQDFSSFGEQIWDACRKVPNITIEVKMKTTLGPLSDK
jgi:hypothetical protein